MQKVYKTWCHEHCFLGGSVRPEVVGDERLIGCSAMNSNNNCKRCGHSYNIHMHRTYDMLKVRKDFLSPATQEKINRATTEKQKAELKRLEFENLVTELQDEDNEIREIAAEFAAFLKTYAVIPFNDAMGAYIETQIKDEEAKARPDRSTIEELRTRKNEYERRKEILTKAMCEAKNTDAGKFQAADKIKRLEQKAYSLKHFGGKMKTAIEGINTSKAQMPQFHHGTTPKPPAKAKKGGFRL